MCVCVCAYECMHSHTHWCEKFQSILESTRYPQTKETSLFHCTSLLRHHRRNKTTRNFTTYGLRH